MKSMMVFLIVCMASALCVGNANSGTMRLDLGNSDVSEIDGESLDSSFLNVDLSELQLRGDVRILSAYLYLEISGERAAESDYSEEIMTIGVSPCSSQGEINGGFLADEYTLLPGVNRTVVLDITNLCKSWASTREATQRVAIYGRDEREEAFALSIPDGLTSVGWVELRYSQ